MMKVLLLSGDVHCGKTTLLKGWCDRAIAAGTMVQGTLAWPDDERGLRHFTSLPAFETRRAQVASDDGGAEERALAAAAGVEVVRMKITELKDENAMLKERILSLEAYISGLKK